MAISDLEFLQRLTEQELTELVVIPLLERLEYRDIRYTHGILEYGKDIVCAQYKPLDGYTYVGFTIKSKRLSGSVSSSRSIRETYFQIKQALKVPFVSPIDGNEITLRHTYVLTPYDISQTTIRSIQEELREQAYAITFIDGPKLLDLIRKHMPNFLSSLPDPTNLYLLSIQQRFLQLGTPSALGSRREVTMPEIYTGGDLSPTTQEEARYISFTEYEPPKATLAPAQAFSQSPFLILLADVGTGKTTFLKKFALDLISTQDGDIRTEISSIPVFIELSTVPSRAARTKDEFFAWLRKIICGKLKLSDFDFTQKCNQILLLDGFDEIQRGHEELQDYIENLKEFFPSGIIITSRPSRIPILSPPFQYYRLNPLNEEEIHIFLKKWFRDDTENTDSLFDHIRKDSTLLQFCRTPLLLTLYSVLAAADPLEVLPSRKAEIYESITTLLLARWDSMRNVTNQFSSSIKTFVLEKLAMKLHGRGVKLFRREDIVSLAEEMINQDTHHNEEGPALLFDELIFRSSLIRRTETNLYVYSHLSFQEFFAAKQLIRLADKKVVQRFLFTDWWKNCLIFYFGLTRTMDGLRLSSKKAFDRGYILIEYLADADYTSDEQRMTVFEIMAQHIMRDPDPPGSVLDACRKLQVGLIPAMERVFSRTDSQRHQLQQQRKRRVASPGGSGSPDINTFIFFDFILRLGPEGERAALRKSPRLSELPPTFLASIFRRCAPLMESEVVRKFSQEIVKCLRQNARKKLWQQNLSQREAAISNIHQEFRLSVTAISQLSSLDTKLQARIIETIKGVEVWIQPVGQKQ
ncbi:MAG: NACHT domain-containing protein [Proteobacteria bacterium]|nr:NACHT domain-containing protein [Pseudomonadota bacterium]